MSLMSRAFGAVPPASRGTSHSNPHRCRSYAALHVDELHATIPEKRAHGIVVAIPKIQRIAQVLVGLPDSAPMWTYAVAADTNGSREAITRAVRDEMAAST